LDYRDHEFSTAACETLTHDVLRVMVAVQPEVVLTFGPTGISGHEDHKTVHRAATEAFHRYRPTAVVAPRLYDVAIPPEVAAQFAFRVHPSELTLSVCLDIAAVKPLKLQGLRMYRSQRDAQELAVLFASEQFSHEWFYQTYPVLPPTASPSRGLWPEAEL
jgi:N-acetylglucosamine malate deacetylase 2